MTRAVIIFISIVFVSFIFFIVYISWKQLMYVAQIRFKRFPKAIIKFKIEHNHFGNDEIYSFEIKDKTFHKKFYGDTPEKAIENLQNYLENKMQ